MPTNAVPNVPPPPSFFSFSCSSVSCSTATPYHPTPSPPTRMQPNPASTSLCCLYFKHSTVKPTCTVSRTEFGSLLGYVRAGRITKHDNDIDLLIDKSSLGVLDRLTNDPREPWYVDQRHHRPLPSSGASVFLHRTNHREDFSTVVRVDCNGNTTKNMRDACSFSGPVSRLVSFNASSHKPMAYIDVYVSGCPFHRPFGQYKSWHCRTATKSCSFCPSGEALNNSLVERSGGTLERCRFDGVETWCPSSRSWSIDYLSRLYGPSWQTVRKDWKYSDRPSKRRI